MLGAFGAHGLAGVLGPEGSATWDTAVQYHLIHALSLCLVGSLMKDRPGPLLRMAGWAFASGVLLFSGSLYVLALDGPRLFGPITPLGGVAFIVGWIALALSARSAATS